MWISWWTALQPEWRIAYDWPFPQHVSVDDSWDNLLIGGKDGLFIVIMSLGWWCIEDAKSEGDGRASQLKAAISDVSWVLSHLVSAFSADELTFYPSSSPTRSSSPVPQVTKKVGRPNKRSRLR